MTNRIGPIVELVAKHYGISPRELVGSSQIAELVLPRHLAMYLCRILTTHSLHVIGREFGKRHHTTVLHAIRSVTALYETEPTIRAEVDELIRAARQPQHGTPPTPAHGLTILQRLAVLERNVARILLERQAQERG